MQRKPQLQPYRVDLRVGVLPPDAAALGETEWSKAHRVGLQGELHGVNKKAEPRELARRNSPRPPMPTPRRWLKFDTPASSTKEAPPRRVHGSFCGLLDQRALREATANFRRLDRNSDGKLSLHEFRHGLGLLGLSPSFATILFNAFDKSRDGAIDAREFLTTMAVMLHPSDVEAQAALAFEAYDLNGDGRLDRHELRQVLGSLHGALERAGLDAVEEAAVDAAADSLLALMDVDGKGHVALDDYRRIVRDHPEELRRAGLGVPTRRSSCLLYTSPSSRDS